MKMKLFLTRTVSLFFLVLLALPLPIMAQNGNEADEKQPLTTEQLTQLLAPVALYPDELLAQVLMASTYPLEIVMADRWVQQNKELKGTDLATALEKETWDPSVKSLVNFPSVLSMLSQKLDLTTKLGDAFLEQKDDVMDTVQQLREKAVAAGSLKTSQEQKVVTEGDSIVIEPANPQVIYVPAYDPYVVYGPWWYPDYPPFYFYSPPYPGSLFFSYGYGISLGFAWGYAWGGWNWHDHDVVINVNRNVSYNPYINRPRYVRHFESRGGPVRNGRIPWRHDPGHRRGVAYKDKETARDFGQMPGRRGEVRGDSRGFTTPGRIAPAPRTDAGSDRRGSSTVKPLIPGQTKPPARGHDAPVVLPQVKRESVFTGGDGNGTGARRSSERGRQSIDSGSIKQSAPTVVPRIGITPDRGSRSGVSRPAESGGSRSGGGFSGSGRGSGGSRGSGGGGRGANERR
jgi:hypothetical protein